MRPTRHTESQTFRAVRRACYAGLDSVRFREVVADRIAPILPCDGFTFATLDPDTGLLTHAVSKGLSPKVCALWIEHLYPHQVALEILDLVQRDVVVERSMSAVVQDLLAPEGYGHDLRTILGNDGAPWGFLCFLRERSSRGFRPWEAEFMTRLAPHLTRGLQTALLVDSAGPFEEGEVGAAEAEEGVGLLVLDGRGRVRTRNAAARQHLADLADVGVPADTVPHAVASTAGEVLWQLQSERRNGASPLDVHLHARGRSGRWYRVLASRAETNGKEPETLVLIEPARRAEVAPLLTRLYGLTPREREALSLVARGASTQAIARRLGISPYTVQEHIGNACNKVGVRTRKELVAKLFLDSFDPEAE